MAAALDFPLSPSINDIYVANGNRWQWNGTSWRRVGNLGPQGVQGPQGTQGIQGVQGTQGVQGSNFNRESFHFIATDGQTDFSVLNASANNVDVFVNGVHLTTSEFTIVDSSTIRLHESSVAGDVVDIFTFESAGPQGTQGIQGVQGTQGLQGPQGIQGVQGFSFLRTEYNYTATEGQTTFAASYVDGTNLDIFLNGVRLTPADYTATSGTNVVLTVGANAGDIVDITAFESAGPQGIQGISGAQGAGTQGTQGVQGTQGLQGTQGVNIWEVDSIGIHTESSVGIATTTANASYALDVHGNVNFNGLLYQNDAPFISSYWIQNSAGIHTLGSVGVGTTSPVGSLEVSGHTELDDLRVSGVSTFSGNIDANGDLDVDGHTELDNVNVSGVLTATSAEFSGNVTVGGTLIYEDVTNVDSIGIATARSGLRITGGGLDVVGVTTFNNGVDTLDVIGHAEVDQLRVSGVSTFTGNVDANGDLDVEGHTELDNVNVSGVSTFVGIVTTQDNLFVGNDLSVAGDARIVGVLTVGSSSVTINGDTNTINVGTGVTIHTTTASVNQLEVAGVSTFQDNVSVAGTFGVTDISYFYNDVRLFSDGNGLDLSTSSSGGQITNTGTGDLTIKNNLSGNNIILNTKTDTLARFLANSGVELYYDNSKKFETVGAGVTVYGTNESQQLNVTGVSTFSGNVNLLGTYTYVGDSGSGTGAYWSLRSNQISNYYIAGADIRAISELRIGHSSNYQRTATFDITNKRLGINTESVSHTLYVNGNSYTDGNATFASDLDVDGHTELDGVNIAGVLTATSAEFSGNVTVLGDLTYENVLNVDSVGIATARAGLRVTGGGLDVVGVSTFSGNIDANGDLDVEGHTELDNLNVSGVSTFAGNVKVNTLLGAGAIVFSVSDGRLDDSASLSYSSGFQRLNTVNMQASGDVNISKDLDVNGHTELDNVNVSGVLTATSFVGDGSQLTGVSGFATALSDDATSPLNKIFKTPKSLYITPNTQIDVDVSVYEGSVAFVRENVIIVGSGATFHIGSGTTMKTNVLNLF